MLKKKIAGYLNHLAERMNPREPLSPALSAWYKDQGDKTLRLDYPLDENSTVFDLGGYEGQWTSDIYSKYNCTVYVFEVFKDFYSRIQRRFIKNKKIRVFPFGLSNENKTETLSILAESSSQFRKGEHSVSIELKKASDFLNEHSITTIDLMKMNIEGGEFDLLEHLISGRIIPNIINLQIQFHDVLPDAVKRMKNIQQELSKTHRLTYSYEFVWENWERKSE